LLATGATHLRGKAAGEADELASNQGASVGRFATTFTGGECRHDLWWEVAADNVLDTGTVAGHAICLSSILFALNWHILVTLYRRS